MKVHGLVTCRNRRDTTIRSVGQLCQQFQDLGIEFSLTLVDDGSTDGTATAVSEFLQGDDDELLQGDGNLYWAGGMRYGWEHSAKLKDFDYLLIFNDDINLYENALASLIEDLMALRVHNHKLILVAPFYDNDGMSISYSGYKSVYGFYPLKTKKVIPSGSVKESDTFNCNLVFLQKDIIDSIGFFRDYFAHSGADIEYGLRAKRNGANIYVARKASGVCSTNSVIGTSFEQGITIIERFKRRHSIKESPHRQKYYFMKENGGNAWMFFWIYSYLKIFLK